MIGGSLLLERHSLHDGRTPGQGAHAAFDPRAAAASSPWGGSGGGGHGDLARQAGLDDIGRSAAIVRRRWRRGSRGVGLFDDSSDGADDDVGRRATSTRFDDGGFDVDDGGGSDD